MRTRGGVTSGRDRYD